MNADKNYWKLELEAPYSPSQNDFSIYKNNLIEGTTLLLGCTKILIPISNFQMDIDPWYEADTVIIDDWKNNKTFYSNIIGDGVLNFTKDLTDAVLRMCQSNCNKFTARCFNHKLSKMRVANYFPSYKDFEISPQTIMSFKDYTFYFWNFYESK
jgi:hypothetical protein